MKSTHEGRSATEKTSVDTILLSDETAKEMVWLKVSPHPTYLPRRPSYYSKDSTYPNSCKHLMAGFEPPMRAYSTLKRTSGWIITLITLALVLATMQCYHPRNLLGIIPRSFGPDYASQVVELPLDSSTTGLSLARTDQVQFDNYSLILRGQRIFLQYDTITLRIYIILNAFSSGEFHTFRLPVPSLWPDILEKVKAAGMNAVSVYTHMGLINPAPGVVDFDGFRALEPLYSAAKAAGIWIVLRPGKFLLRWLIRL